MKRRTLQAVLLFLILLTIALVGDAQGPQLQVVPTGIEQIPGNAIPLMCNGGYESGDWTCWQDRSIDPWTWIASGDAFEGGHYMRQGGKENAMTGTYQVITMTACAPSSPIWIVHALRMHTELPDPGYYTATAASLFSDDWKVELAYLYQFYEGEVPRDQWWLDVYRVENAAMWGKMALWIATETDTAGYPTYWDHDGWEAFCVPGYIVYLPLVMGK